MIRDDKVNILLVDDQPGKLLSYEVILSGLGERLVKASSAREAFEFLLKNDVAVVLIDVCMPELDGFQLASMIRAHPRFQRTAIIFISAILMSEIDHLRGYEMGAVDYVPVPVVPELLRAKVRVFAELYRTTRKLEALNEELEQRVTDRTAELQASNARLMESEQRRSVALAAGNMGAWEWEIGTGECVWDPGQYEIFGIRPGQFPLTLQNIRAFIHPADLADIETLIRERPGEPATFQTEARILRPNGEVRWCICAAAVTRDGDNAVTRVSGVTIDITDRKEAEDRQLLLAREVDHRARNALAVVHAIVRLTTATTAQDYMDAVEGRIRALAQTHALLSQSRWQGADIERLVDEECAPYRNASRSRITAVGPSFLLSPEKAQILALALHELATNAAKYGALSTADGAVAVSWQIGRGALSLEWCETGGPKVTPPVRNGFGSKIMNASIKQQIGGDVTFDWRTEGLHCALNIPLEATGAAHGDHAAANLIKLKNGEGRRILIVEDEILVGILMRDTLTELGLFAVGPFCSLAEATDASRIGELDAAILDINLSGEFVYPLAEELSLRGVPCIFLTGYDEEILDPRFALTPVLQKPVNRQALDAVLRAVIKDRTVRRNAAPASRGGRRETRTA